MKRALTHDEALDAIVGTMSVTVLSYQEAIESYLMLRRLECLFTSLASAPAIEARRAETQGGSVEDESAMAKPDAQGDAA
jgi:hypothetical protein